MSNEMMMCCASCGIAEKDDIKKLKMCTACKSVRYCSVKCQKDHRPKHKRDCKKRAAELRDEILFKQPESSHLCDCPICCLPLSIDPKKSFITGCCSKVICFGCEYANRMRELEGSLVRRCPYCRQTVPETDEEADMNLVKRAEANDPVALREVGMKRYNNEGDCKSAFQYYTKAAELGDAEAHYQLSCLYHNGKGVAKDKKKQVYHLEQAAIDGHPGARHNLGSVEEDNGGIDRAIKHLIIAANLGHDGSIEALKGCFKSGYVSKEDYAAALRAHQAAVDATKSPQRDEAEARRTRHYLTGQKR